LFPLTVWECIPWRAAPIPQGAQTAIFFAHRSLNIPSPFDKLRAPAAPGFRSAGKHSHPANNLRAQDKALCTLLLLAIHDSPSAIYSLISHRHYGWIVRG